MPSQLKIAKGNVQKIYVRDKSNTFLPCGSNFQ